jgi:hypothetical protein
MYQKQQAASRKTQVGCILCDSRTSGLFDTALFDIIATREGWKEIFEKS